ncbi:LysR substrate-binding domain protein [Bordetella hinzii CA90 BAL1384]|nr:LysR substrate-binding domain protein [Bordetella hinzii CA90 BAL1384]
MRCRHCANLSFINPSKVLYRKTSISLMYSRRMTRPNLVHAQTLCWIARLGTFAAAAERMHTTQPAVSARMKELETALGYPLFERRGRRQELTLQARRFVDRVAPLLHQVEAVFNDTEAAIQPAGTVRLGLGEVSMSWLGALIPALRRALPRVTYEIELDLGVKLRERLAAGTLDVALIANSHEHPDLAYTPLGKVPMVWVCATSLLFTAQGRSRSLDELLRRETLWCVSKPSDFFAPAYNELRAAGADMGNLCACNKLKGLIDAVTAGGGIALLPQTMVARQLQSGELALVPGNLAGQTLDFAIAVHRNQSQPAVLGWVAELLRLSRLAPIGAPPPA